MFIGSCDLREHLLQIQSHNTSKEQWLANRNGIFRVNGDNLLTSFVFCRSPFNNESSRKMMLASVRPCFLHHSICHNFPSKPLALCGAHDKMYLLLSQKQLILGSCVQMTRCSGIIQHHVFIEFVNCYFNDASCFKCSCASCHIVLRQTQNTIYEFECNK